MFYNCFRSDFDLSHKTRYKKDNISDRKILSLIFFVIIYKMLRLLLHS